MPVVTAFAFWNGCATYLNILWRRARTPRRRPRRDASYMLHNMICDLNVEEVTCMLHALTCLCASVVVRTRVFVTVPVSSVSARLYTLDSRERGSHLLSRNAKSTIDNAGTEAVAESARRGTRCFSKKMKRSVIPFGKILAIQYDSSCSSRVNQNQECWSQVGAMEERAHLLVLPIYCTKLVPSYSPDYHPSSALGFTKAEPREGGNQGRSTVKTVPSCSVLGL